MTGPAPKPTASQLAECMVTLMDLYDHAPAHELPVLRVAIEIVMAHRNGGES